MEDLSVFVRYYPDKNFESQLSADKKILVKVRALGTKGQRDKRDKETKKQRNKETEKQRTETKSH